MATIASVLRDRRRVIGLTQADVASRADIARPYLTYIEQGRRDPSLTVLLRLCDVLGLELEVRPASDAPPPRTTPPLPFGPGAGAGRRAPPPADDGFPGSPRPSADDAPTEATDEAV